MTNPLGPITCYVASGRFPAKFGFGDKFAKQSLLLSSCIKFASYNEVALEGMVEQHLIGGGIKGVIISIIPY